MFWVAVGFVWDCLFTVILLVSNNCLFLFFSSFTLVHTRSHSFTLVHSVFCKMLKLVVVILGGYKVNEWSD